MTSVKLNKDFKMKKLAILGSLAVASISMTFAEAMPLNTNNASPHFYVVMENQTDHDLSMSFKPVVGDVSLIPVLSDHTSLAAHQSSQKYGVVFATLGKDDSFSMTFSGNNDCTIKVGFFAPGVPTISMAGPSCYGAGYRVVGDTLFLSATDVRLKVKA